MSICSQHDVSIVANIESLKKISLEDQTIAIENMEKYASECQECLSALTYLELYGIQKEIE